MASVSSPVLTTDGLSDRFILIVKPEQSGKTFLMIQKINQLFEEDKESDVTTVNFIFCDNNLLLTKQTKKRIEKDVTTLPDIDEAYVEFSSCKDGTAIRTAPEVREAIEEGCRNVVCCTNSRRVIDIKSIIDKLNKYNCDKFVFNLWLDEADKYSKYIKEVFIPLTKSCTNVKCYMMTATPQPLFNKYGDIHTLPIENTTSANYHGWKDNNIIICVNETETTLGFARQIADDMLIRGEFTPGSKGYVPANFTKKSHYKMRDIFVAKGVAVFVVNGDGIELTIPTKDLPFGQTVSVKKTKELHEEIIELYNKYNIASMCCIITGNICVGRAISIMQPNFMIDFGILCDCSNKAEASQNAGRLKGNVKGWSTYKAPTVYTTVQFDKVATECEIKSREIAQLAFSKADGKDVPTVITKSEAKNIHKDKEWELIMQEFDTLEHANNLLHQHGCRRKKTFKRTDDGFIQSTTTKKMAVLSYSAILDEMKGWSKVSTFDVRKERDTHSRMFVCYKDLTDKESVVYIVRIIKKKRPTLDETVTAVAGGGGGESCML